jgi:tRNA A37 N6-isopentenylltransferase MiaA
MTEQNFDLVKKYEVLISIGSICGVIASSVYFKKEIDSLKTKVEEMEGCLAELIETINPQRISSLQDNLEEIRFKIDNITSQTVPIIKHTKKHNNEHHTDMSEIEEDIKALTMDS